MTGEHTTTQLVYILIRKEYEKAKNELENSPAKENEINQNLAIIFAREGEFKKLEINFMHFQIQMKRTLHFSDLRKGEYNKAARFFKG